MYKAIGEAAYNDGLFSQAAPFQAFQASVSQFGDGGLGATSRLVSSSRAPVKRHPRARGAAGFGNAFHDGSLGNAYRDGSLGNRTFLPAFSKRAMQGLGYTFRDGVLGDDVTVSIPGVTSTPVPAAWKPDLASVGVGLIAGGLLFYFTSKH